jgi:hypothetical protein
VHGECNCWHADAHGAVAAAVPCMVSAAAQMLCILALGL